MGSFKKAALTFSARLLMRSGMGKSRTEEVCVPVLLLLAEGLLRGVERVNGLQRVGYLPFEHH